MNADHLIELAEQMLQIGGRSLRQTTAKRSISTTYYALFHALADECVARTVGAPRSSRYWEIVTPIYRSIDHGAARKTFERLSRDRGAGNLLRQLSDTFLELQSARHAADYDPGSRYSRRDALDFVVEARRAIAALRSMPKEDRMLLAVQLITKPR